MSAVNLRARVDNWELPVGPAAGPNLDLPSMSVTISGYWDTHQPPIIRRAAPIVLKLRPGKAFRAHSQLVTEFRDDGAQTTVELSPADDARLHQYLHPEVYARRSAMHSAYHRRRR